MEIMEILSDALSYPLKNPTALIVYIVLGIICGLAIGGTSVAIAAGMANDSVLTVIGGGIVGIIVTILIGFIITGYELDIIKLGIEKSSYAPQIDPLRQFLNGVKYFVVNIVYLVIPIIITAILAIFFKSWLITVIAFILGVVFGLALMMAQCRLAKTEDLTDALAIGEAIGDIGRIGFIKVLVFIVLIVIIALVLSIIGGMIMQFNSTVGGIFMGIIGVYLTFFISRATGLLYSAV